ncbi:MAG: tetratricopeptide repeat protein [Phycisphaeraceae bacterium]|nr:tetratricopeptide repeat protein [Phycisphaeraceae bacterium]
MADVFPKIEQARQHVEAGRIEQARALLDRALRQNPGHPDLCNAMSLVLQSASRFDQALFFAERAAEARPNDPGYRQNLANILAQLGRAEPAEAQYRAALALNPAATGARLGLSHILRLTYRFAESTAQLEDALRTTPNDVELFSALAPLLLKQARVEDAVAAARRGLELDPHHHGCAAALAHCLNYMPGADPAEVLAAHRVAGGGYSAQAKSRYTSHNVQPDPDRRLRIGLLSGDLRRHAITFFLEPFIEHHDRAAFELACYSTCPHEDEVSASIKKRVALWRSLAGAAPETIASAIHKDRVDILIELFGHAAGHQIPVVVMKPAPVQADFLGYPATTGIPEIDYRFVDSLTDPPGAERFASEHLIRLDPSFLCYSPMPGAPPCGRTGDGLTFGSFNSAPKLNAGVFRTWASILSRVPRSRLILKCLEFNDPALPSAILARFAEHGVDPARIECLRFTSTVTDHLAVYHGVDIALDPFPYNGTTTTFDALFMGVPVVSLRGDRHVARVSSAILTNLGHPELIAQSQDQYIDIATSIAADPARLRLYRDTLRARLLASSLADGPAFAARLSGALRSIWHEWCARPR